MHAIIHFLIQLVMLPVRLVRSPIEFFHSTWTETGRGRFLLMGLPALIIAFLGLGAWAVASISSDSSLKEHYLALADRANQRAREISADLNRELRVIASQVRNSMDGADSQTAGIPDDDPRVQELKDLYNRERIYLEKLIALDPEADNFKYRLAEVSIRQGDIARGLSLMQKLAPMDKPQYAPAHLWMARYLVSAQVRTPQERQQNLGYALQQVEHCLSRDQGNRDAMEIKAQVLETLGRLNEAYEIYSELFDLEPSFYVRLIELNRKSNRQDRNDPIVEKALLKYEKLVREDEDTEKWVNSWEHFVNLLHLKRDYARAESELSRELEKYQDNMARRVFLRRKLASVYSMWAAHLASLPDRDQQVERRLELLKKSYELEPRFEETLRQITAIATIPEYADQAREIYDGRSDPDAPASVLSELGTYALTNDDYDTAVEYFEFARKKSPGNALVLNNLAYSYLVCENRNPERALLLIDQALRILPQSSDGRENYLSHFLDTRGLALMQLNRMEEAAANFEVALKYRPDNKTILENLIKCYEGRLESQAETYRRKLAEVIAKESRENEPETNSTSSNQNNGNQP